MIAVMANREGAIVLSHPQCIHCWVMGLKWSALSSLWPLVKHFSIELSATLWMSSESNYLWFGSCFCKWKKQSVIFCVNSVTVCRNSSTINAVNSINEGDAELKWNESERTHISVDKFCAKALFFTHNIWFFYAYF